MGLHLPDLLPELAVLASCVIKLCAVGAVPGDNVGDMFTFVVVKLLEHEGKGVGVLGEEGGVGVAAVFGLF